MVDKALQQQMAYYARRELGLCVRCGQNLEPGSIHVLCNSCKEKYRAQGESPERREWRRQYMKDYRDEIDAMCGRIALAVQKLLDAGELNVPDRLAKSTHKCWGCYWGTWCGDRFFCPIYETCIKEPTRREVTTES